MKTNGGWEKRRNPPNQCQISYCDEVKEKNTRNHFVRFYS